MHTNRWRQARASSSIQHSMWVIVVWVKSFFIKRLDIWIQYTYHISCPLGEMFVCQPVPSAFALADGVGRASKRRHSNSSKVQRAQHLIMSIGSNSTKLLPNIHHTKAKNTDENGIHWSSYSRIFWHLNEDVDTFLPHEQVNPRNLASIFIKFLWNVKLTKLDKPIENGWPWSSTSRSFER